MTNKTILKNFLIEQEQIKSKQFHNNASAGNNGPYNYVDTPVRNTAHWAIIYSYLLTSIGFFIFPFIKFSVK